MDHFSTLASRLRLLWLIVALPSPMALAQGPTELGQPRLLGSPAEEAPPTAAPVAAPPAPATVDVVPAPTAPARPGFFQRLIAIPAWKTAAPATTTTTGCAACDSASGATAATVGGDVPNVGLPPLAPNFEASADCNCGPGDCYPGRGPCYPCTSNNCVGRFFCDLYECICCPDPCYQPRWTPLADSAFFVESARPQTTQMLRWERGIRMDFPDRSEFFFARADGAGSGPSPLSFASNGSSTTASIPGVGSIPGVAGVAGTSNGRIGGPAGAGNGVVYPVGGRAEVSYDELMLYTESVVNKKLSLFTEMPYRAVEPNFYSYGAGFSDMTIGSKTLLFDCELLQVAFLFRTYLPIGNPNRGVGTGHVSLEPSVVIGLKLAPETFFQGEISETIPIGGDTLYEGPVMQVNGSINHTLCRLMPNVPLIGTFEVCTWSFQGGAYTDLETGTIQKGSGSTYASAGPGLRLHVCDRFDFGVGTNFALTNPHWAEQLYRVEFRFRF